MESWAISLAVSIIMTLLGIALMAGMYRNKISVLEDTTKSIHNTFDKMYIRLDRHGDDIISLNTKSELSMTAKDVDDKYVSKELFRQFEKHIDKRFDRIEEGQDKILRYIEVATRPIKKVE